MKRELDAIKSVRASRSFGIFADHYIVKDQELYASDGKMSAAIPAPFPKDYEALIPGDELDRLIARLDEPIAIATQPDSITFRSGPLRGTIATQPIAAVGMIVPEHEWNTPPDGLTRAMALARPFVAEVAAQPYATTLCLRTGALLATTNISLLAVDLPGLITPSDLLLPAAAVDFVIKAETELTGVILHENYCAFRWSSGLWCRSQLVTGRFPEAVGSLLAGVAATQPLAISPAWRRAYAAVAALSEGVIALHPEKIVGGHGHSQVVHETTALPLAEPVHFDPRYCSAVVELATAWNPAAFPAPVPFIGVGCRGLLVGRRA